MHCIGRLIFWLQLGKEFAGIVLCVLNADPMIKELIDEVTTRIRAPQPDNEAWFEAVSRKLELLGDIAEPELLLDLYVKLISYFHSRTKYMIALRLAERGLEIASEHDLKPHRRHFHHLTAVVLKGIGDNGRAVSHLAIALDLARSQCDVAAECRAWAQLASTMLNAGKFEEAIAYARRSLALAGSISNLVKDAKLQCNQIIADASLHLMHDPEGRQRRLAEGLLTVMNAVKEAGEPINPFAAIQVNRIYHTQTQLLLRAGQFEDAQKAAELCKTYAEKSGGNPEALLRADIGLSMVDSASGKNTTAKQFLSNLLNQTVHRDDAKADIVAALAYVYDKSGDTAGAEEAREELYRSWQRKNIDTIHRILDYLDHQHPASHSQILNGATAEAVETLAICGELYDDDTGTHVFRVGAMARLIAIRLGMSPNEARQIDFAARLHDLGKIAIHADIMQKPSLLTQLERTEMQKHALIGADMLARIGHPTMRIAAEIAGGHHERWDGTGYPLGVTGDKIPYSARITAVADVFDALTHARCYKKAWSTPDAIAEISRGRGTVFDPLVVDAFMAVIVELINQHGHDGVDDVLSANSKDNALITAREFLTNQMSGQRNVS